MSVLPRRNISTEEKIDDSIPFGDKMKALTSKFAEQFVKGNEIEKIIHEKPKGSGMDSEIIMWGADEKR